MQKEKKRKKEKEKKDFHAFVYNHPCLLCAWLLMTMCICTCLKLSVFANVSVCDVCWCVGVGVYI